MVLAKMDIQEIHESLQYEFLYNEDVDSIHMLLNLYDLEDNMINICPKYISIDRLRKRIKRFLIYRKDRELITNNISLLIHEDIHRLELVLYLKGYKDGYYDNKWVNKLEDATIKYFEIEDIYYRNTLFHHSMPSKEIKEIKKDLKLELKVREEREEYLYTYINEYSKKIIKDKILNLNKHIDKQLTIKSSLDGMDIKEESFLTSGEINKIYDLLVDTLVKNTRKIYFSANWFGINDKVINRYF